MKLTQIMKRMNFLFTAIASLTILASCENDDRHISPNNLPQPAQALIEQYFPELTVSSVVKDYDDFSYSYEAYLSNGTKLEFTRKGDWKDIDCHGSKVPDGLVPAAILSYVQTTYPANVIVQISRDNSYYDVDLDNDLDLVFNKNGKFVRIDH